MVGKYSAYRRGPDPVVSPDIIDRIFIGACAAIWLVLIGVSVAAAVALADLGRGFHRIAPHTTWVLYAVIIVSALIIAGAIPVLLRARRAPQAVPVVRSRALQGSEARRPVIRPGHPATRGALEPAPQPTGKVVAANTEWSGEAVDRAWLRGTLALTGAIGVALIGAAAATYLMAVGHDGPSWVSYGLAGAVTAGMPAIEWLHVRQLRRVVAGR